MTGQTVEDQTVAPLEGELPPRCKRDVDTLRRFVLESITEESPAAAVGDAFKEVLLTGATGFVGRFFLRDLLWKSEDLVVHCLVRAENDELGRQRIENALREAELWDDSFGERIQTVAGDIEKDRFGLSAERFEDLGRRIDAVYHSAARLSLTASYAAISKANTWSIRSVLELCLKTRFKHLFYVSTMGIFPEYFLGFQKEFADCRIDHQMTPDIGKMTKHFPLGLFGYSWSKLVTEQVLLHAHQAGLPLAIFRFPIVNMASTGFFQAANIMLRIVASVNVVNMRPPGVAICSAVEPVDTLSEFTVAISLNPRRSHLIYQCCNPEIENPEIDYPEFGFYFQDVSYEKFKLACRAHGDKLPVHSQWALLDYLAPYWLDEYRTLTKQPVCDRAIREDCPHPILWPNSIAMLKRFDEWIRKYPESWPYSRAKSRLDYDCMIQRAETYAADEGVSFEEIYPEWMRKNLKVLLDHLNLPETRILEEKRSDVVYDCARMLINHAKLAGERQRHPEIRQEEIIRPVFIIGINRSGTTFLHRLMSRDPRFGTLRLYEYGKPVMTQEEYATVAGTEEDPRRRGIDELIDAFGIRDMLEGSHYIDIDEPEEDFPLLRMAFLSWIMVARYPVPTFRKWLVERGSQDAYTLHREIMRHFNWQHRQRKANRMQQWLFKMPFHLMELETLLETYPDAVFIQTHREPIQFMASWNSLVEQTRSITCKPGSRHELGAEQLKLMSDVLHNSVDFRLAHPELKDRWVDVKFTDLIGTPIAVMESIYERFNWPLEEATIGGMEKWMDRQAEHRSREKRRRYQLEEFGLTEELVNSAFDKYRDFITSQGIR